MVHVSGSEGRASRWQRPLASSGKSGKMENGWVLRLGNLGKRDFRRMERQQTKRVVSMAEGASPDNDPRAWNTANVYVTIYSYDMQHLQSNLSYRHLCWASIVYCNVKKRAIWPPPKSFRGRLEWGNGDDGRFGCRGIMMEKPKIMFRYSLNRNGLSLCEIILIAHCR